MLDRYKAMTDPEEAPAPPASPAILGKKTSWKEEKLAGQAKQIPTPLP